jgi:hypothetical protein
MDATLAALLGAVIGGLLSVLASWLAQRIQARGQWLAQEIRRWQELYSEFLETAVGGYGEPLLRQEPDVAMLAKLYGELGGMRLHSSPEVIEEGLVISDKILDAHTDRQDDRRDQGPACPLFAEAVRSLRRPVPSRARRPSGEASLAATAPLA